MGNNRRGRVTHVRVDHDFHAVAGEYLNRAVKRRLRKGVRIHPDEERTADAGQLTILKNRLADGQHVVLIKAAAERGAAVTAGAEDH